MLARITYNTFYECDGKFAGVAQDECLFKDMAQLRRIIDEKKQHMLATKHMVYEGIVDSIEPYNN